MLQPHYIDNPMSLTNTELIVGFRLYGGRRYDEDSYRVLLIMDMFGLTDDEAEDYPDTGAGLPDNVLFNTLSNLIFLASDKLVS